MLPFLELKTNFFIYFSKFFWIFWLEQIINQVIHFIFFSLRCNLSIMIPATARSTKPSTSIRASYCSAFLILGLVFGRSGAKWYNSLQMAGLKCQRYRFLVQYQYFQLIHSDNRTDDGSVGHSVDSLHAFQGLASYLTKTFPIDDNQTIFAPHEYDQ